MATRTITPVTAKGYEMLRKHLDHERLNKPVGKITADDVQGWIDDKRGKGTSDNTLNKALNQLKYAYRWGVRMGYLKTNPCDPIKPPKRAHRDPNPLDEENLTKIIRALETVREENPAQHVMVDAALIALNTGMRIGEVCGLAWDDVDGGADGRLAEGGQIHVNNVVTHPKGGRQLKPYPKNGDRRDIPMNPQLVRILKRRRAEAAEIAGEDLSGCYVIARDKTPGRCPRQTVPTRWGLLLS